MTDQELNEAVARKLGYKPNDGQLIWENDEHVTFLDCEMPPYCTDIKAAWEVLEKLNDAGIGWDLTFNNKQYRFNTDFELIDAPTAPRAICEAFLKLP